tara:strand:- start:5525 stop:5737 length:213 start_codon:yes stop_codon:yes gene_type:complete
MKENKLLNDFGSWLINLIPSLLNGLCLFLGYIIAGAMFSVHFALGMLLKWGFIWLIKLIASLIKLLFSFI